MTVDVSDLERSIAQQLAEDDGVGLACAAVLAGGVAWAAGFGWADVEREIPMTADTVLNIASVSKTVTATTVLRVWEDSALDLDADVSDLIGYEVRNPRHPDRPITPRQLLTHRSSIKDGPAYDGAYVCGPYPGTLRDWLIDYLRPGGEQFSAESNFHAWPPGTIDPPDEPRPYSNVNYGLLGDVVASVTGEPFAEVCRREILSPAGMDRSGWFLDDIDLSTHAALYSRIPADRSAFDAMEFVPEERERAASAAPGTLFRHCLYAHPTYPDGFLRTSVRELGRFLALYSGAGEAGGRRILRAETIETILSNDHFGRALCWQGGPRENGTILWHHGGADPGVRTIMTFDPARRLGILLLSNLDGPPGYTQDVYRMIRDRFS